MEGGKTLQLHIDPQSMVDGYAIGRRSETNIESSEESLT